MGDTNVCGSEHLDSGKGVGCMRDSEYMFESTTGGSSPTGFNCRVAISGWSVSPSPNHKAQPMGKLLYRVEGLPEAPKAVLQCPPVDTLPTPTPSQTHK